MAELYWSKSGEIACAFHAPSRQDQRWALEQWEPLATTASRLRFHCERCNAAWPAAQALDSGQRRARGRLDGA